MSLLRYVAPALALASVAYAQCTYTATNTVSNVAGASSLAACTAVSGSIVIQTGAASGGVVSIPNVETISGSLTFDGAGDNTVTSFQMGALTSVGDLTITNLTALASTAFTELQNAGNIKIENCGGLTSLGMTKGVTKAGVVTLGNTLLSTLTGLDTLQSVGGLAISGNPNLNVISLNVAMSSGNITITANDVTVGYSVALNNLSYTGALNIQNATTVSLNALTGVAQDFYLIGNEMKSFSAPNLTYSGGLYIQANPNLANVSFPALTMINGTTGAFTIQNNTDITSINGFPALAHISADINFRGGFSNISLPALTTADAVKGSIVVYSSQDIDTTCTALNALKSNQTVAGTVQCKGQSTVSGTTGNGTSSTGSGSSTSSSAAAVAGMYVSSTIVGAGVFAGLLQFLLSF